jgi:hypothetical protein
VSYLGLRCQQCAGLRCRSQGYYRNRFERSIFARASQEMSRRLGIDVSWNGSLPSVFKTSWDPRAISDPRLIAAEFSVEIEPPPMEKIVTQPGRPREKCAMADCVSAVRDPKFL